MTPDEHRAKAAAFTEAADHLQKLADLADGPNAGRYRLALLPSVLAFLTRADRERQAADQANTHTARQETPTT